MTQYCHGNGIFWQTEAADRHNFWPKCENYETKSIMHTKSRMRGVGSQLVANYAEEVMRTKIKKSF